MQCLQKKDFTCVKNSPYVPTSEGGMNANFHNKGIVCLHSKTIKGLNDNDYLFTKTHVFT